MGSKPKFTLLKFRSAGPLPAGLRPANRSRRPSLQSAFLGALTSALAAAALVSCISDGANKTGGEYLGRHGILLKDSLFHVTLKNMPVDTFWATDAFTQGLGDADIRHLGDTILLAGRSGNFSAVPRMTFQVADTAMLDSLVPGDSTTLRLSLAFPEPTFSLEELKATVEAAGIGDSMRFEVAAWDSSSAGIANDKWNSKVVEWNGQFLFRQDTTAALPSPTSRDTIAIKVTTAYKADSVQVNALPNLFKTLAGAPSSKHFVHLRLTHIPGPAGDSGAAMLRLGGWLGDDAVSLTKGPLLLFGKTATTTGGNDKNRLRTMLVSFNNRSFRAVDYALRYDGSRTDIISDRLRGLHLILDRAALLDSIDAALRRNGKTPQPRSTDGDFDLSYFVPFAKLTLPVDSIRLEGGFPLKMSLSTETDTLLADEVKGGILVETIPLGESKVMWRTPEPNHPEIVRNQVSLGYETVDGDLRRVTLRFSSADSASMNDTLFIRNGETKDWATSLQIAGINTLSMSLTADSASLIARGYLRYDGESEDNDFRDPETGKSITDIIKLLPHYVKPGDTAITLRATTGFQRLLNRARTGVDRLQSFVIQPPYRPIDTSVTISGNNTPTHVPYPVLFVIPPKLISGRLTVDVELYLFPLKAR